MAKLAASGYDHQDSADGESYIEKYIKSVAAVESIITLDRLGQVSVSVVCVTTKTSGFSCTRELRLIWGGGIVPGCSLCWVKDKM